MIHSMGIVPNTSSSLELSISMPGFSSSTSVRDLDINRVPRSWIGGDQVSPRMEPEEEEEEEEEEEMINNKNNSNIIGSTRKKLRLTKEQSRLLEETFRQHHTLNPKQKEALALQLKLRSRQVEVWFQNRRARSKLKQTEMECEYLKRWFGSLTEQNRRLQREVDELRAMKVGPAKVISPHGGEPLPASALTMCPSCERVSATTSSDKVGPTSPSLSSKVATPNL